MPCPFLREAHVRFCDAAAVRKMIVDTHAGIFEERCSSLAFHECELARRRAADTEPAAGKCPFLHGRLVRYCGAAAVPRFIPFSDPCGRCGTEGYRYCDVWLRMSRAGLPLASVDRLIDRLQVPEGLLFAPNHMWLDVGEAGSCYVGIDALLADVLGRVEHISFVTMEGVHRPSAVVTAHGIDWPLVFPHLIRVTGVNIYMRHSPERLTADPYGAGWLFEGSEIPQVEGAAGLREGLVKAADAAAWMAREAELITRFVHGLNSAVQNDGGTLACGFAEHLSREDRLRLLNDFFAPHIDLLRTN